MSKGRPLAVIPPVVVVYRKREKGKAYMSVFENADVDSIINGRKHNSLIPTNYLIEDLTIYRKILQNYIHRIKILNLLRMYLNINL